MKYLSSMLVCLQRKFITTTIYNTVCKRILISNVPFLQVQQKTVPGAIFIARKAVNFTTTPIKLHITQKIWLISSQMQIMVSFCRQVVSIYIIGRQNTLQI